METNDEITEKLKQSILQSINEAADYQRENLDAHIIRYFGSEERARELVKYFVVEEDPIRMEVDEQFNNPYAVYRMTHTYRIRPKTAEELHHDRADAIVAKHTAPQCIVCHEPVNPDDFVDTRHGAYHEWCVDGHA